jgi:hypothetical protein
MSKNASLIKKEDVKIIVVDFVIVRIWKTQNNTEDNKNSISKGKIETIYIYSTLFKFIYVTTILILSIINITIV